MKPNRRGILFVVVLFGGFFVVVWGFLFCFGLVCLSVTLDRFRKPNISSEKKMEYFGWKQYCVDKTFSKKNPHIQFHRGMQVGGGVLDNNNNPALLTMFCKFLHLSCLHKTVINV